MATPLSQSFLATLHSLEGKPCLSGSGFQILSKLLENPVGCSFLAQRPGLDIPVLVRVADLRNRMELANVIDQMRLWARVRHPQIAAIVDFVKAGEYTCLVSEYLAGIPLCERLKNRPLTWQEALNLFVPLAQGLQEVWRRGLVHRMVCPQWLAVDAEGVLKLDTTLYFQGQADPEMTAHFAGIARPYWSPEELRGDNIGPAADVWSFGATLYHALTGRTPFHGATPRELDASIMLDTPVAPRALIPALPPALENCVLALLNKDAAQRHQIFRQGLERLLQDTRVQCGTDVPTLLMAPERTPRPDLTSTRPLESGDVIAQCRLLRPLGEGAFGVVWLAQHSILDIPVAVKVLSDDAVQHDPDCVERFMREARTVALVRHPNVIGIFAAGQEKGHHFIVMEYAPNGNVGDLCQQQGGIMQPEEVRKIMLETARGLQAIAQYEIVHRDIKPANLLLGKGNEVKIGDLGLARRRVGFIPAGEAATPDQITLRSHDDSVLGTPLFMAPEMALDPKSIDGRADLYALGITAYYLLTGQFPFKASGAVELVMQHVKSKLVPPKDVNPNIDAATNAIVTKLLQKRPRDRHDNAGQLVAELTRLQERAG